MKRPRPTSMLVTAAVAIWSSFLSSRSAMTVTASASSTTINSITTLPPPRKPPPPPPPFPKREPDVGEEAASMSNPKLPPPPPPLPSRTETTVNESASQRQPTTKDSLHESFAETGSSESDTDSSSTDATPISDKIGSTTSRTTAGTPLQQHLTGIRREEEKNVEHLPAADATTTTSTSETDVLRADSLNRYDSTIFSVGPESTTTQGDDGKSPLLRQLQNLDSARFEVENSSTPRPVRMADRDPDWTATTTIASSTAVEHTTAAAHSDDQHHEMPLQLSSTTDRWPRSVLSPPPPPASDQASGVRDESLSASRLPPPPPPQHRSVGPLASEQPPQQEQRAPLTRQEDSNFNSSVNRYLLQQQQQQQQQSPQIPLSTDRQRWQGAQPVSDRQFRSNAPRPPVQQTQQQHQRYYDYSQAQVPPQPRPSPIPRRHHQQHAATLALKSLWRKVERGLDGLANVEEAVTERAQQLYSSTVSTVKDLPVKVPAVHLSVRKMASTQPVPPMDMSRFQKKIAPSTSSSSSAAKPPLDKSSSDSISDNLGGTKASNVQTNPLGVPVRPQSQQPSLGGTVSSRAGRAIDWNSVRSGQYHRDTTTTTTRIMRANGGASVPPDQQSSNVIRVATGNNASHDEQHPPPLPLGGPFVAFRPQITATTAAPDIASSRSFAQRTGQSSVHQPNLQQRPVPSSLPVRLPFPDEDVTSSIASRIARFLPPVPRLNPFRRDRSYNYANSLSLDAWKADEEESQAGRRRSLFGLFGKPDAIVPPRSVSRSSDGRTFTAPMADLMERCREGKAASLLNKAEKDKCRSIGRQRAILDLLFVTFLIAGARQFPSVADVRIPQTVVDALTTTVTDVFSLLAEAAETWAPLAFAGAVLAIKTRSVLCDSRAQALATAVESSMLEESQYGSLFLRLTSSMTVDRTIPQKMQAATRAQILAKVDVARLQSFVTLVLAVFFVTSASIIQPLVVEWLGAVGRLASLELWNTWPPQGGEVLQGIRSVVEPLWRTAYSLVLNEIDHVVESPLKFACKLSIFIALYAIAYLPAVEGKRRPPITVLKDDEIDEDDDERNMHERFTEQVINLGTSAATRLDVLSVDGRINRILERWRTMMPRKPETSIEGGVHSMLRLVSYGVVSSTALAAPFLFCTGLGTPAMGADGVLPQCDYLFDVAAIVIFTQHLVWRALSTTIAAEDLKEKITRFVSSLVEVVEERRKLRDAPPPDLTTMKGSFSPTAGISVKDLWASHTTKRAWAIRGATLNCQNGEILVLLGDDGAGKSRLLTTMAESVVSPPGKTLSSQRVRGSISIAGLEVTKWDNNMLKRKLGLSLCDVRSISDTAQVLSGLSLEEILSPCDGLQNLNPSHSPDLAEKSAMMLALKLTGLYSTLLRRLPSKMSTVVTASEDDLSPNPLRPRYHVLSPSEWSKLLLARVLAQTIFDNENSAGRSDATVNSLVGSVLLLDDPTLHLSEVEEGRFLRDLRSTGAATVITSNRWATGRFADKIAVLKDGAIVEFGTHSELLARGPRASIYAAKWHSMTTNS